MTASDKELRENLMRDLDILHTVNHKKGERPDLYGEMNLIDKYAEAYAAERERLGMQSFLKITHTDRVEAQAKAYKSGFIDGELAVLERLLNHNSDEHSLNQGPCPSDCVEKVALKIRAELQKGKK